MSHPFTHPLRAHHPQGADPPVTNTPVIDTPVVEHRKWRTLEKAVEIRLRVRTNVEKKMSSPINTVEDFRTGFLGEFPSYPPPRIQSTQPEDLENKVVRISADVSIIGSRSGKLKPLASNRTPFRPIWSFAPSGGWKSLPQKTVSGPEVRMSSPSPAGPLLSTTTFETNFPLAADGSTSREGL